MQTLTEEDVHVFTRLEQDVAIPCEFQSCDEAAEWAQRCKGCGGLIMLCTKHRWEVQAEDDKCASRPAHLHQCYMCGAMVLASVWRRLWEYVPLRRP